MRLPVKKLKLLSAACLLAGTAQTHATDIGVVGLFPGKAILVVDGASPKTYTVGSNIGSDAKLVDADRESATVTINGKRKVLTMGQTVHRSAPSAGSSVVLRADDRGHFTAPAMINGISINMLVDTGASLIALPATEATRLGINYRQGAPNSADTAGGVVKTYHVKLDKIKIGDVELYQVDASIIEQGLTTPLLGMSFLNRMDMRREGDQMTLTKRY